MFEMRCVVPYGGATYWNVAVVVLSSGYVRNNERNKNVNCLVTRVYHFVSCPSANYIIFITTPRQQLIKITG